MIRECIWNIINLLPQAGIALIAFQAYRKAPSLINEIDNYWKNLITNHVKLTTDYIKLNSDTILKFNQTIKDNRKLIELLVEIAGLDQKIIEERAKTDDTT